MKRAKIKTSRYQKQATHTEKSGNLQKFYRSCPWDKWWDDFLTAREHNGALTYSTAWDFCKEMGRDRWERQVIYWCIGPKPRYINKDGSEGEMPVKWLGDWQNIRDKTFNYSDEKIENLKRVLDEQETAIDAGRGVATVALDWVAKSDRWAKQIDRHFKDLLLVPSDSLAQCERRFKIFINMQKRVMDLQFTALHEYLRCQGVGSDDLTLMAQMQAVGLQAALKSAQGKGAEVVPDTIDSPTLALMFNTFKKKSQIYGLGMPEADLAKKVEAVREDTPQPVEVVK